MKTAYQVSERAERAADAEAYRREKMESWYDARDEYILDKIEEMVEEVVRHINNQPYRYEVYTTKDVREMVRRLMR